MLLGVGSSGFCSAMQADDYISDGRARSAQKRTPAGANPPGHPHACMAQRIAGRLRRGRLPSLTGRHVGGLLALGTLDDLELDRLALGQGLEALTLDGRVVHEHVLAAR